MNEDALTPACAAFSRRSASPQREIEKAVRDAVASGSLKGHEKRRPRWCSPSVASASPTISGEIELGQSGEEDGLSLPLRERTRCEASWTVRVPRTQTSSGADSSTPPSSTTGEGRRNASPFSHKGHHHGHQRQDSNGALLAEGDTVTLIKDLKLKGSSTVLKRGTVIKGIHLTDNADEIEGRTDKVKGLVLRSEFLKKA